jgi:hypothetical protein
MATPSHVVAARGKGLRLSITTASLRKLEKRLGEIGSAATDLRIHKHAIIGEIVRQNTAGRKYINRTGRMTISWLATTQTRDTIIQVTKDRIVYESRVPYAIHLKRRGFIRPFSRKGIKDAIVASLRSNVLRSGRRGTGRR